MAFNRLNRILCGTFVCAATAICLAEPPPGAPQPTGAAATPQKQDPTKPALTQPPFKPVAPQVPGVGQPISPMAPTAAPVPAPELGGTIPDFKGPGIAFDTPIYDFGKLMAGGVVKHDYWFTNVGKEKLVIQAVKPGCGCTTTGGWDKELMPGETGRIPISVNTGKYAGPISKGVTISTNIPEMNNVQLTIKGDLWMPVQVTPPSIAFGSLMGAALDQEQVREADVVNNTEQPLEIKDVTSPNAQIRAEVTEVEKGKKYKLKVKALPPFTPGNLVADIKLKTNNTQVPEVSVIASAYIPSPVQIVPPQIMLPAPTPSGYDRQVTINNNTGKAIEVSDLKVNDPKLTANIGPLPGGNNSFAITVKIPENYTAPPTGAAITLKTNVKGVETLTVPIYQSPPTPQQPLQPGMAAGAVPVKPGVIGGATPAQPAPVKPAPTGNNPSTPVKK